MVCRKVLMMMAGTGKDMCCQLMMSGCPIVTQWHDIDDVVNDIIIFINLIIGDDGNSLLIVDEHWVIVGGIIVMIIIDDSNLIPQVEVKPGNC